MVIPADIRPVGSSESRDSPRRSYVVRHWRGDLSLPVSYWINFFLGTIGVVLVFACASLLTEPAYNPLIVALIASLAGLFAIATNLWQLVGVWRSAGKHKGRGGSGFWAVMARFVVILGFLGLASTLSQQTLPQIAEYWRIAAGDPNIGKHDLHILRGGTELEYAGGITFGATDEVRKLLDTDPSIHVIHLNSSGGRLGEARKLRDLIRERKLVTYTASACASACTIAFMGGVQRFIAPEAKLGFHRASFPGMTEEELAQQNEADRRGLIGVGVPAWFADRAYSTPSDSMWWPTSDELRRASVITGVAGPHDFTLSGFGTTATEEDTDKELQKIPLFVAVKHVDPEVYRKISAAVIAAGRHGKSQAELVAVALPYVSYLSKKYLPVASDDAVIAAAEMAVIEAEIIGRKSADACYDFLYPHPGSRPVILSKYLAGDVQEQHLLNTVTAIETGSTTPQRIPTEKEVSPLFDRVVDKLTQRYTAADIAALANASSPGIDHGRVCTMTNALVREVLALPTKDKAQLLRFLFAQGFVRMESRR